MKKISVIVPVFNRERTIIRCVDSILAQDFLDFECLLVDDGSTDSSLSICKEYAKADNRIIVLHKENGGVSSARNLGLDNASGEWVCFVDSDDMIKKNHLSSYIEVAGMVDIVYGGYETAGNPLALHHSYGNSIYMGEKGIRRFLNETDVISFMPICDKMYRRSIIENNLLRFDETLQLSEDRLFTCWFLLYAHGIATISNKTYLIDSSDLLSLSVKKLSTAKSMNRYKKLKTVTNKIVCDLKLSNKSKERAENYIESLYAELINAHKNEGNTLKYYLLRFLHKIKLF